MAKRSAYKADIDDNDAIVKHTKREPITNELMQRSYPWHYVCVGLDRFFRATDQITYFPSPKFRTFTEFRDKAKMVITWKPAYHFARRERQWKNIFTLLLLYHHEHLSVPFDVFELIVHWYVSLHLSGDMQFVLWKSRALHKM